ncbi:hypothetical protein EVA_12175 [gut metagenome]|uniref:Uncharacterized protein n=1 Tax=gut metagenome TaxID=749906 RepID=J9FYR8_9ZZZZ
MVGTRPIVKSCALARAISSRSSATVWITLIFLPHFIFS